jgi:hypothetical protein
MAIALVLGILGIVGTAAGTWIGARYGWKVAKTQSDAETQRQKDKLETESVNAHAEWLREQRVIGYLNYLRAVDQQRLYIQLKKDRALLALSGVKEPRIEDVQDALSLVAFYGPDTLRQLAYLVMNKLTDLQAKTGPDLENAFVDAKNDYIDEARKYLNIPQGSDSVTVKHSKSP